MRVLKNYNIETVKQRIDESTTTHCEDLKKICLELAQALAKDKQDPKYLGIPNISFSLVAPGDDREELFAAQRLERGFDSSELWSLKDTITNFILPRLKAFADDPCGYPGSFNNVGEWQTVLNKMIRSFELSNKDTNVGLLTKKEHSEWNAGMKLFKKYFFCLWN